MIALAPKVAYFCFSLAFCVLWFVLYVYVPRTRKAQLWISLVSLPGGPLIEVLYFRDYWQPQSVFSFQLGPLLILVEDLMFAFAFSGVSSILYQLYSGKVLIPREEEKNSYKEWVYRGVVLVIVVLGTTKLCFDFGMNSIFATSFGFVVGAIGMACFRDELLLPVLLNGTLTAAFYLVCLLVLYGTVANIEELSKDMWHLHDTRLDLRFWGVPLTELFWAFCFGAISGPLYAFVKRMRYA